MPPWLQLMLDSLVPLLWAALVFTIPLTLASFVLGLALGLVTAVVRLFGPWPLVAIARFYVWVIRGTPLLVQLFVIFYGLPSLGILLDAFPAALIGFTLNVGAYTSEIIRAVISSVPRGQWEAAQSLALSFGEQLRYVVLPQALTIAVPPTVGFLVQVIKGTALASVIGFIELTKAGTMITNATFKPFVVYSCVALMYFALCYPISLYARGLERTMRAAHR